MEKQTVQAKEIDWVKPKLDVSPSSLLSREILYTAFKVCHLKIKF